MAHVRATQLRTAGYTCIRQLQGKGVRRRPPACSAPKRYRLRLQVREYNLFFFSCLMEEEHTVKLQSANMNDKMLISSPASVTSSPSPPCSPLNHHLLPSPQTSSLEVIPQEFCPFSSFTKWSHVSTGFFPHRQISQFAHHSTRLQLAHSHCRVWCTLVYLSTLTIFPLFPVFVYYKSCCQEHCCTRLLVAHMHYIGGVYILKSGVAVKMPNSFPE